MSTILNTLCVLFAIYIFIKLPSLTEKVIMVFDVMIMYTLATTLFSYDLTFSQEFIYLIVLIILNKGFVNLLHFVFVSARTK